VNRLDWELFCATEVLNTRRLRGSPIPQGLRDYHHEVESDWEMSGIGRKDCGVANASSTMGVEEVAAMLHCSKRHVRRIAPSLGAQRVNYTWIFERASVENYVRRREPA
jgi:hypothetical protein